MPPLRYLHYDVFTDRPLEGNQLAVFPDGRGLSTETMQAIAREMNFSETTFVLPAERPDTDVRMRIFTPAAEMPMAGHPTVGSTFALAHEGVIAPSRGTFVFGLGVGPVEVGLEWAPHAAQVRLLRDNVVIHEGKVSSLRRFKEDVNEVKSGLECGIGIANYNDVKPGDVIEFFTTEKVKEKLE